MCSLTHAESVLNPHYSIVLMSLLVQSIASGVSSIFKVETAVLRDWPSRTLLYSSFITLCHSDRHTNLLVLPDKGGKHHLYWRDALFSLSQWRLQFPVKVTLGTVLRVPTRYISRDLSPFGQSFQTAQRPEWCRNILSPLGMLRMKKTMLAKVIIY